tara:strand:+ start:417 stop:569 length:153 start_codon:yes stop_codon:yes gene_type:complete
MDLNEVIEWLTENFDIRKLIERLEEYLESETEEEEDLDYEVDDEGFFSLI